jgi:hypothetical protein
VITRLAIYPIRALFGLTLAIVTSIGAASTTDISWPVPKVVELAPGIVEFTSPELTGNVDGNLIAISTDQTSFSLMRQYCRRPPTPSLKNCESSPQNPYVTW